MENLSYFDEYIIAFGNNYLARNVDWTFNIFNDDCSF